MTERKSKLKGIEKKKKKLDIGRAEEWKLFKEFGIMPYKAPPKRLPAPALYVKESCDTPTNIKKLCDSSEEYTLKQLREIARIIELKGYSTMNKEQLCKNLQIEYPEDFRLSELRKIAEIIGLPNYQKMSKKELCYFLKRM